MSDFATEREIAIVFGVYVNPAADWRMLVRAQLNDLQQSGLLAVCDLCVIVSNSKQVEGVVDFFEKLPVTPSHLEVILENKFEYPAISCVWNLANSGKHYKYIGYLHTKGMSYAKRKRDKLEQQLTQLTFGKWRQIVGIFEDNPDVDKVGLFPESRRGFIWFNFWWARSRLLGALPRPQESDNRYSYESWLGRGGTGNCYSILGRSDSIFTGAQATLGARYLVWKAKYGLFARVRLLCELAIRSHRIPT